MRSQAGSSTNKRGYKKLKKEILPATRAKKTGNLSAGAAAKKKGAEGPKRSTPRKKK